MNFHPIKNRGTDYHLNCNQRKRIMNRKREKFREDCWTSENVTDSNDNSILQLFLVSNLYYVFVLNRRFSMLSLYAEIRNALVCTFRPSYLHKSSRNRGCKVQCARAKWLTGTKRITSSALPTIRFIYKTSDKGIRYQPWHQCVVHYCIVSCYMRFSSYRLLGS